MDVGALTNIDQGRRKWPTYHEQKLIKKYLLLNVYAWLSVLYP